ncbi:replication-relaxation family protein [Dactylosporangium sp. AC04546]|uniref:replication-relaxation family protein n=1 Tax=Dactylosporangium sp. AC04546 TaxID=2862460 RepID=UPI001EDDA0CD|nr:replication-relaxation family protein [Dactylosporangium sp. AC04546]WVK82326.1 replication-relaxation family protein [Dactylosporangium sp. AC04546]
MTEKLMRVQAKLTARDLTLLGWLEDHGVLTSFQIAHALFPSVNFAQRRLRSLMNDDLVDRFRPQRQDGGSHPYHYVLGQLGADVVSAQRGADPPRRDHARKRRWQLTNRANLPHLLGVNDFFIRLNGYARTHPGAELARWWPAKRCQGVGAFAGPAVTDAQQLAYVARIRPDGHGIWVEAGRELPFFLEYDTGTEPLSVLVAKLAGYAQLADVTSQRWPVLFSLHSSVREANLHRQLTANDVRYPVATTVREAADVSGSPADAVWWRHRREGPLTRLIDI